MTEPEASLPSTDCTACNHPQAAEIDAGLLAGTPVRTIAGTYGLSRSAVGRHRQNHLSAGAITDPPPTEQVQPLTIVDVHRSLTALADRLEKVVEQAARTRKATAAVAATRELRQTLIAIADTQATDELRRAVSKEIFTDWATQEAVDAWCGMIDRTISAVSGAPYGHDDTHDERSRLISDLVHQCLQLINERGLPAQFRSLDTTAAQAYVERKAIERADRIEAEVQRRVEAELARRERQARPAIEARPVLELEGGSVWTA